MPRHQQVTTCLKNGGPVSKSCSCPHCALAVCEICGAGEGTLTTDCPGMKVDYDRQQEACQTNLDYTDDRGWHQGSPTERRAPRFVTSDIVEEVAYEIEELQLDREGATSVSGEELRQLLRKMQAAWHKPRLAHENLPPLAEGYNATRIVGCACGWHCPPDIQNSDEAFALHAAQAGAGNVRPGPPVTKLEHSLIQKAIAWVKADRAADQCSADMTRVSDELRAGYAQPLDARAEDLLRQLEQSKIDFRIADQHAVQCDDEFRQAARQLVDALERGTIGLSHDAETP